MAIPNVTSITNGEAGTIALPGSSQAYISLVAANGGGTEPTVTPPANWTLLEAGRGDDVFWNKVYAYYANASSSPGTSWATSAGHLRVAIVGLDAPIAYIEDAWLDSTSDGGVTIFSPDLGADEAALVIRSLSSDVYTTAPGVTYPPGVTSNQTLVYNAALPPADTATVALGTHTVSGAGATGTAQWASTAGSWYRPVAGTIAVASGTPPPAQTLRVVRSNIRL